MQRRTLIRALLASSAYALPSCSREDAKAEALRSVIERVVVPNTAAVVEDSRRLEVELAQLAALPTLDTLGASRQSWRRSISSWKRLDAFRIGPVLESNSLLRAMFWPVRSAGIDALLQGEQAIDEASIDAMGVDRRGLFALEYLLFAEDGEEQIVARFTGGAGERRARLARALAGNISFYATGLARSLADGTAYARKFAEGGQESLNRLVAQLVYTVESVSANRLARTSTLAKNGSLKATAMEGGLARVSQLIALTSLRAAEELYLAAERGLCQLVKSQSAAVDRELRSAFARAIAAVSDLGAPLEDVAKRDPAQLDAAAASVKSLERALKVDLTSLLGVTASFASVDGD
ncbi:MAG TPA: imelysin family protein [Polyangiaceae bacterium]|nr:imelysin family protein [Polyangiaceae bacterium]